MTQIVFGILLIFMGWNLFIRRSWWAEQASMDWVIFRRNFFEKIVAWVGVLSIIGGLIFIAIGIDGILKK